MTAKTQLEPARLALEHRPSPTGVSAAFTAPQKAALIIAALGPEAAGPIIDQIGEKNLKAFAEAYARLQNVPRKDLLNVASEFVKRLDGGEAQEIKGGFEETRRLLAQFKGEDNIGKYIDDIDAPGGPSIWKKLESSNEKSLAVYLSKKSPQVIAVVLSRLDTDKASSILAHMDDITAQDVIIRLSRPMPVRRQALQVLANTVETEYLIPARKAARAKKPGELIGAMLNNMSEEKRNGLLNFIETKAPDILNDVKSLILTFQDIPGRLPANAAPQVVREVDAQTFLRAVKYGRQNAPETVEFIFANISQRMVQQYEEQILELKPVTVPEAEAAQAEVMLAVRKLVAAGEFELNKIETEDAVQEVYI